jgi:membrane protein implicated in regulation of membrane protease activity
MWDLLFTGQAAWFSIPALVGTGLFLLKLVLMLAGGDHDGGLDGHDAGHGGLDHGDADVQYLSVQGVLAFLMGFGWAGLLVLSSTSSQLIVALAAALVVGSLSMYGMARAMGAMMKLQASGNVEAKSAVGATGTVYVGIPGENRGMGQVTVVIDQKQRTYNAVTAGGELPRDASVRVVGIQGQNTLMVEAA